MPNWTLFLSKRTNSHICRGSTWPYRMTSASVTVVNEPAAQSKPGIPEWHVKGPFVWCLNTWNLPSHLVCVLFCGFFPPIFALHRCAFFLFSPSQPRRAESASLSFPNVPSPSRLSEHRSSLDPAVMSQQRLARTRRARRTSACSVCSRVTHPNRFQLDGRCFDSLIKTNSTSRTCSH